MLQNLEIEASELLIVEITSKINKISLPQGATIVEKGRIVAIQAYSVAQQGKTPNQKTVVNTAAFGSSFLTLRDSKAGKDRLHQIPLGDLVRNNNSGVVERIRPLEIDISQSFIEVGDPTLLVVGECYMFRCIYEPYNKVRCPDK